jgi:hypothetical protein
VFETANSGYRYDLFIDTDGKVGIGTGSPAQKLHVNGLAQFDVTAGGSISASTPGGWPGFIAYEPSNGYRRDIIFDGSGMRLLAHAATTAPPNTNGIVIHNNGGVGIGTDTPTEILHCYVDDGSSIDDIVLESDNYPYIIANSLDADEYCGFFLREQGSTVGLFQYNGPSDEVRLTRGGSSNGIIIETDGNVGLNTTNAVEKLTVNGTVKAKEFWATLTGWSDYVFYEDYELRPIGDLEQYIKENKHLPDMPSEAEVLENGVKLAEMDALILKKIEELTLYTIEQQKEIDRLKAENEELKSLIRKED